MLQVVRSRPRHGRNEKVVIPFEAMRGKHLRKYFYFIIVILPGLREDTHKKKCFF